MELVDIFDKDNNVIGQTTKHDAHQKGLLHRTIIAEVINSKGKMLLIQQAHHKQEPGLWVSPMGGHITSGESEVEALKRETLEELGIQDFTYFFKGRIIVNLKVKNHIENHYFIIYEIYSDAEPILNSESSAYKYFTKEELKKEIKQNSSAFGKAFYPVFKNFYPELLD